MIIIEIKREHDSFNTDYFFKSVLEVSHHSHFLQVCKFLFGDTDSLVNLLFEGDLING